MKNYRMKKCLTNVFSAVLIIATCIVFALSCIFEQRPDETNINYCTQIAKKITYEGFGNIEYNSVELDILSSFSSITSAINKGLISTDYKSINFKLDIQNYNVEYDGKTICFLRKPNNDNLSFYNINFEISVDKLINEVNFNSYFYFLLVISAILGIMIWILVHGLLVFLICGVDSNFEDKEKNKEKVKNIKISN